MRFHDTGDTTASDEGSRSKESHFDHILVSENTRLLHRYVPLSYPGQRQNIMYQDYVPVSPFRGTRPTARNYDLSDHLPVRFIDSTFGVAIGTWNLKNFNVNQVTNMNKKEGKYADTFTRVFSKFDILALQEVSGLAAPLYGKNLRLGSNSLGIAFSTNAPVDCQDIPISGIFDGRTIDYRSAWGCLFGDGSNVR